jgi:hypothetical protein
MNAQRESRLAQMFVVGGVMIVGGLFGVGTLFMGFAGFAMIGVLSILGGIGVIGWAVFSGLNHNNETDKGGPRLQPGYVMARFAVNEIGEMIFSNYEFDAVGGRFYVRLRFEDGHDEELECAPEVFDQAGEGMWGHAAIRGRWLGQFTPIPKPVDQPPLARF